MPERTDITVIGSGPAGLAAAVTAAETYHHVTLIDAGQQPGGQYWRHPDERYLVHNEAQGHHGWDQFSHLRRRLYELEHAGRIDYLPGTQAWFIERPSNDSSPWTVHLNSPINNAEAPDRKKHVQSSHLILAPGGYDRQLPVPGWDLPGVMAAGGVQAVLKGNRTLAGRRALVAGTGPFLLPVAVGLAHAGAHVVAICESGALTGWAKNVIGAVQMPSKGLEGVEYATALARHRIPYKLRTIVSAVEGQGEVETATLTKVDAQGLIKSETAKTVDVDLVAFGWGFTPSMELIQAVGAETFIDTDESLVAVTDDMQRSTIPRVYIAGEATGVGGAVMAVAEGELAALAVAADTKKSVESRRITKLQNVIGRSKAFATAMHRAHPIPDRWENWLTDDTIVCRCEEVTYDQVRHTRDDLHANQGRSAKLLSRPGMGWCQGRICGFACARIAATSDGHELSKTDLAPLSKRTLTAPISLSDLAEANPARD